MRPSRSSRSSLPSRSAALCLSTLALAACADRPPTGPDLAPRAVLVAPGPTCENITFNGFTNGQSITSVTAFGLPITVTTTAYVSENNVANPNGAVAFETDGLNDNPGGAGSVVMEDDDLQYRGEDSPFDADLAGGECAGCNGLGKILVIQDNAPFVPWGDYAWGGLVTFTGAFSAGSDQYYIESFNAVDVDENEIGIELRVDGTLAAQSASPGNGSVQTVVVSSPPTIANSFSFELGTAAWDGQLASGGIDNIRICRIPGEVTGGEGCTLGYWKQEQHYDSWTGYTTGQDLNTVFDFTGGAAAFASLGDDSFLDALNYKGGADAIDAAGLLLKQAVAVLLNASSTNVDYALTTAQIVAQVNAALDSGNRNTMLTLAGQLDGFNNAGCPLN